jgi:hypothetical protein
MQKSAQSWSLNFQGDNPNANQYNSTGQTTDDDGILNVLQALPALDEDEEVSVMGYIAYVDLEENVFDIHMGVNDVEEWYALEHRGVDVGVSWGKDGLPIVERIIMADARYVTLFNDWINEAIIQALPDSYKDNHVKGYLDTIEGVEYNG